MELVNEVIGRDSTLFLEMFKKYFEYKRELQLPVLNDSVSILAAEKRSRILTQDEDVVDKSTSAPMNDPTIASEVTSSSSIPYSEPRIKLLLDSSHLE